MAQLALTVAGTAIGTYFGGPIGGAIGGLAGSLAGAAIDQALFPQKAGKQAGPRLGDLLVQNASYGTPIARVWGQMALSGNLIWSRPLHEVRTTRTQSSGGKGSSGPSTKSVTYSYYGRFAVGVCEGPIAAFGRIWADGKLIRGGGGAGKYDGYMTFYTGTESQDPDPTIQSYEGVATTPAYRGLAYIVFNDLPLADFGNRIPNLKIEVITRAGAEAAFDSQFQRRIDYVDGVEPWSGAIMRNGGHSTDRFGNFILTDDNDSHGIAFAPDGTILWRLTLSQMADLVDGFAGSAIVGRGPGEIYLSAGTVQPICGGNKLLMLFSSYGFYGTPPSHAPSFENWVAILEPVASGMPTVLGVVRYRRGAYGVPMVNGNVVVMVAGLQTEDDPILVSGYADPLVEHLGLVLLPSVNEITNGAYAAGWGPAWTPFYTDGWDAYEVPYLRFKPLSSDPFDHMMFYTTGHANENHRCGFCLPVLDLANPSMPQYRTNFYISISKLYVAFCTDVGNPALLRNDEFEFVLAPSYPDGCMVKIDLGVLDFSAVAGASLVGTAHSATIATDAYTVDNASWQLSSGGSALPFADEFHSLSDGSPGGVDAYNTQPALIEKQADGSFLVVFVMMGAHDAHDNWDPAGGTALMYAAARAFLYDPITGTATQIARLAGPIYSSDDIGYGPNVFWHDFSTTVYHAGDTLYFWGNVAGWENESISRTYLTRFGSLSLTGDVGLDEIVGDVCDLCGLEAATDYDASALSQQRVRGYAVGRESDARTAIEPLRQAFFFDGVESSGKLKWAFRGGSPIGAIAEDDLGTGDATAKVRETRRQDFELPRQVIVRYLDPDRDFQAGAQQAKRIAQTMGSRDLESVDVPIVMTAAEAIQVAQKGLYLAWIMRTRYAFTLPLSYLRYDPADVLTLTWQPAGGTDPLISVPVYLTELAFGADGVLEAKGLGADDVVYLDSPAAGAGSVFPGQTVGPIEPAMLALMDLPPLRDEDDDFGFYVAMAGSSDAWRGATLYRSLDGVTYEAIAFADAPTPMGVATTALAPGPTAVHDDANTVTVRLRYGALSSVTRAQSLNGANAALLGDEILTFDTASLVAETIYTLSGLLRGRKGTEWATGSHAAGERFVLLDPGTIARVADQPAHRNVPVHYKAVSAGLAIAQAADTLFTDTGASLKPYAPVAIAGSRDGAGNLTITWVRRARLYAEWSDGVDVPLDEPVEAYEVDVLDTGGAVLRTIAGLGSPSASYLAAEQTADFGAPQSNIAVAVYPLSSRVGRGFPGRATV